MTKLMPFILYTLIIIFGNSCSNIDDNNIQDSDWLVNVNQVLDGGPGKDGIPSIDNPQFTIAQDVDYLNDNDLVLGIRFGDKLRAYPHPVLDWHEIVNDQINNKHFALTYCPLTGTGIAWDRIIDNEISEFGVSGLLFESNLMPYDRKTNSTWSQQRLDCVNGEKIGEKIETYSFFETSWQEWVSAYPESEVLNLNTGFSRDYNRYPYGDYRTNNEALIFPVSNLDRQLASKERVMGILENDKTYATRFPKNGEISELYTIEDSSTEISVISNVKRNFIVAFYGLDYTLLDDSEFPLVLQDGTGTKYDIFGYAEGDTESALEKPTQFIGYWFSWGAFYPDTQIINP